jgi:hypothetical protein
MKFVGEKLEQLAIHDTEMKHANLLGRSAFNRFYYASFLVTRSTLAKLDPKWKMTPHAEIPTRLRETIKKKVANALKIQERKGVITASEKGRILSRLQSSTEELAEMLELAYDARIIADYIPEELIVKSGKVITLRDHKLTTAKTWPDRAHSYCKTILKVYEEVGLA